MIKTAFKRCMIMAVLAAAVMILLFPVAAMAGQQTDKLIIAMHRDENTLSQSQFHPSFLQEGLADFPVIPEHIHKDAERTDGMPVAPPYHPQAVEVYDKNAYDEWVPVGGVDVIN